MKKVNELIKMTYEEMKAKLEKLEKNVVFYRTITELSGFTNRENEMRQKWLAAQKVKGEFTDTLCDWLENQSTQEQAKELLKLVQRVWPREAEKDADAEVKRMVASGEMVMEKEI